MLLTTDTRLVCLLISRMFVFPELQEGREKPLGRSADENDVDGMLVTAGDSEGSDKFSHFAYEDVRGEAERLAPVVGAMQQHAPGREAA